MDITNWGMSEIMQLPDHVFGRRFPVCCSLRQTGDTVGFDVSEIALPEQMVIWQLFVRPYFVSHSGIYIRLALADELPASEAAFMLLPPLLSGLGFQGPGPRQIYMYSGNPFIDLRLRVCVATGGKRMTMMIQSIIDKTAMVEAYIIISSVPREVPDWLCSGSDNKRS